MSVVQGAKSLWHGSFWRVHTTRQSNQLTLN
jgi:hypothetical protein